MNDVGKGTPAGGLMGGLPAAVAALRGQGQPPPDEPPALCASIIGTTDDDAAPAQIGGAPIGSANVADYAIKQ